MEGIETLVANTHNLVFSSGLAILRPITGQVISYAHSGEPRTKTGMVIASEIDVLAVAPIVGERSGAPMVCLAPLVQLKASDHWMFRSIDDMLMACRVWLGMLLRYTIRKTSLGVSSSHYDTLVACHVDPKATSGVPDPGELSPLFEGMCMYADRSSGSAIWRWR